MLSLTGSAALRLPSLRQAQQFAGDIPIEQNEGTLLLSKDRRRPLTRGRGLKQFQAEEQLSAGFLSAVAREQHRWFRDEREKTREEVAAEVDAQPVYQALAAMQEVVKWQCRPIGHKNYVELLFVWGDKPTEMNKRHVPFIYA